MLGQYEEARQQLAKAIELASPATKDQARTAMAVSYAFESRAADAGNYYEQVVNDRVAAAHFNGAAGTATAMARAYRRDRPVLIDHCVHVWRGFAGDLLVRMIEESPAFSRHVTKSVRGILARWSVSRVTP